MFLVIFYCLAVLGNSVQPSALVQPIMAANQFCKKLCKCSDVICCQKKEIVKVCGYETRGEINEAD